MTPERHQQVGELFHRALALEGSERDAFVHQACAGDQEMQRELESLLAAHEAAGSFITAPAIDVMASSIPREGVESAATAAPPRQRIGPYDVVGLLGRGGMGEVYRGHDSRLGRDVALKILPDEFAADPERRHRFEREARLLAALNHPHIAALYGIEEAGSHRALVMELVEGETLSARIAVGALPISEALSIAAQVAEALEAAHDHGIVHRDLKPGNVIVRRDGTVKVLDFGLAKTVDSGIGDEGERNPTLSATRAIVGTAMYMSPEQARGAPVDRRTDIWAFGCVLYEMLTGRRAFDGESVSDVIAKLIERQPDFTALPAATPSSIRVLLQRCLQKNVRDRLRHIGDAVLELRQPRVDDGQSILIPARQTGRTMWLAAGGVTLIAALAIVIAIRERPAAPQVLRYPLAPLAGQSVPTLPGQSLIISSDGSYIAVAAGNGSWMVRRRDRLGGTVLRADGAFLNYSFASPNGDWIGFISGGSGEGTTLKKIPARGGAAVDITTQPMLRMLGATWSRDGTVVFAADNGLFSVSAEGGRPQPLLLSEHPDTTVLGWPEFLPDSRWLLFTETPAGTILPGIAGESTIIAFDTTTRERRTVLQGASHVRYLSTGHLAYWANGNIYAIPFDASTLRATGEPVAVVTDVSPDDFAVSAAGALVYITLLDTRSELVWVDREGREQPLGAPPRTYVYPRLSRDGTQVALDVIGPGSRDVWLWNLRSQALTRLTLDRAEHLMPVWSPDSTRVAYGRRLRAASMYVLTLDGESPPTLLHEASATEMPLVYTSDGSRLIFTDARDIKMLHLDGTGRIEPLVASEATEIAAELSSDDRWLAYASNESGRLEVYVRPFPGTGRAKWQVSTGGGAMPLWSRDGRELFYRDATGGVMAVPIAVGADFVAGQASKVVDGGRYAGNATAGQARTYDVSADGRFLMIKPPAPRDDYVTDSTVVVVENWFEELKRLVPRPGR